MTIDGVALPVFDVDLLHSAKHQLQLSLVEVGEPLERNHFVETVQESLHLLFHAAHETPLNLKGEQGESIHWKEEG